jgi:hypothetical protein
MRGGKKGKKMLFGKVGQGCGGVGLRRGASSVVRANLAASRGFFLPHLPTVCGTVHDLTLVLLPFEFGSDTWADTLWASITTPAAYKYPIKQASRSSKESLQHTTAASS